MNPHGKPAFTRLDRAAGFSRPLIEAAPHLIARDFDRKPFMVRHHLAGHDLFDLPRLLELARYLPKENIEYNAADLPVSLGSRPTPGNGLSANETLRGIRDCRSWMVLKNVEQHPCYAELLEQCLGQIGLAARGRITGMRQKEGFIFVSSPGAVTPYHMDPEHNFLLQIRGTKTVAVFDPADRELLPDETLERFHSGFRRKLVLDDAHRNRGREFHLEPGVGLHFPVTAPHWVTNGAEVSVSFSITFRTRECDRRETLYRINSSLRKVGIHPVAPGRAAWRDAMKLGIYNAARGCKNILWRGAFDSGRERRHENRY